MKHVNEIDQIEADMNLFMVLVPTELTARDCQTHEAEWVVRRGLLGKEGFCVVKDEKKWNEYQKRKPFNRSNRPKPEVALFHECSVEAYLIAPLKEELRFFEEVLQHQKVYRKLDDDISDVFSGLKISAESEETSAAVKNQFRLSFFGLKTPRLPNGFVCLLGARENLIEECKRAETTKKHADRAKLLVSVPFSIFATKQSKDTVHNSLCAELANQDVMTQMKQLCADTESITAFSKAFDISHHLEVLGTVGWDLAQKAIECVDAPSVTKDTLPELHVLLAIHKYPWADSVEVDLPGGKRDFGEDSLATALREMWEETGVNLCGFNPDAPPVLGERVTYHPGRNGEGPLSSTHFPNNEDHTLVGAEYDHEGRINITYAVVSTATATATLSREK